MSHFGCQWLNRYSQETPLFSKVTVSDLTASCGTDLLEKSFSFSSKAFSAIFGVGLRDKNLLQA